MELKVAINDIDQQRHQKKFHFLIVILKYQTKKASQQHFNDDLIGTFGNFFASI